MLSTLDWENQQEMTGMVIDFFFLMVVKQLVFISIVKKQLLMAVGILKPHLLSIF